MADKVQKIREWIKARLDENTSKQSLPQFYGMMEEDARFLDFVDSLQEEPVSGNIDFEQELYKAFGQVKDFTLGIQIAKWFYNMGKDSKDSQEPVSEDLEEASYYFACKCQPLKTEYSTTSPNPEVIEAFKAGAQWQREQFEKNRLKHCDSTTHEQAELEQGFIDQHLDKNNRMPTFLDAIEYGMRLQKEQMMKDAVDTHINAVLPLRRCNEVHYAIQYPTGTLPYKDGDKLKVILIKED